jgi:TetR/AcrR family transcriptional repressor of mexJK operon
MSFAGSSEVDTDPLPSRGRIDKRRAILAAAFDVFAHEGYGPASVDTIAAEADVAKPTIYAHFGSKERLFRSAVTEVVQRSSQKTLAALDSIAVEPSDMPAQLQRMAHRLVGCYRDPQAWSLQRLLYAEAVRFPDLWDALQSSGPDTVIDMLAGRLARFATAGLLDIADPVRAARQFIALITSELPDHTALGARPLSDAQIEASVTAGVETFLRAFALCHHAPADRPARPLMPYDAPPEDRTRQRC